MTAVAGVSHSHILDFLSQHRIETDHYIEYRQYLSNHCPHVVAALYHLGADMETFDAYMDHYVQRLETPDGPAHDLAGKARDGDDMDSLLGARRGYYHIYEHYKKLFHEQCGGDRDAFLLAVLPKLLPGACGAALHPLIHIGYGYNLKDDNVVLEGVAYLHFAHLTYKYDKTQLPDISTLGNGSHSILDVINAIRDDKKLLKKVLDDTKKYHYGANFGKSLYSFLKDNADAVAKYVFSVSLPDDVSSDPMKILAWIQDQAILVYTASTKKNDFFLLHGVTATWSLSQFFPILPRDLQMQCLRDHLGGLLVVYMTQEFPALDLKLAFEEPDVGSLSWEEIVGDVLKRTPESVDEHTYKLIQVCYMLSRKPDCDPQMLGVYKRAAIIAKEYPFQFSSISPDSV